MASFHKYSPPPPPLPPTTPFEFYKHFHLKVLSTPTKIKCEHSCSILQKKTASLLSLLFQTASVNKTKSCSYPLVCKSSELCYLFLLEVGNLWPTGWIWSMNRLDLALAAQEMGSMLQLQRRHLKASGANSSPYLSPLQHFLITGEVQGFSPWQGLATSSGP